MRIWRTTFHGLLVKTATSFVIGRTVGANGLESAPFMRTVGANGAESEVLNGFRGSRERRIDGLVAVRRANEPRFELRWREQHAGIAHAIEEPPERIAVAFLRLVKVGGWRIPQEQREQLADASPAHPPTPH